VEYLIILPEDIFARPQSPRAQQPVLALSEGLDLFSLHGPSFSLLAACWLWPLRRLRSVEYVLALYVQSSLTATASLP
jgi:hypothetical protein